MSLVLFVWAAGVMYLSAGFCMVQPGRTWNGDNGTPQGLTQEKPAEHHNVRITEGLGGTGEATSDVADDPQDLRCANLTSTLPPLNSHNSHQVAT
jgi:hypothetical protein